LFYLRCLLKHIKSFNSIQVMKHTASLIGLMLSLALGAQSTFNFGVKTGINVNYLSTRIQDYQSDNYVGFNAGTFLRFNMKNWHIQPELSYMQRGGNIQFFGSDFLGNPEYRVRNHHLFMPILVGYKLINFPMFNMRLQAGPYGSYLFSRDIRVTPAQPGEQFTNKRMSQFSIGATAGLGIDVWRFTFDMRHHWGLVNMMGDNTFQSDPGAGIRNGTWELSIGFKLFSTREPLR